jgi:hypothetical protein
MKHALNQLNQCKFICPIPIFSTDILINLSSSSLPYILTMILYVIGYISQFYENVILKQPLRNLLSKKCRPSTLSARTISEIFYENKWNRTAVITVAEKYVK